jgi:hypothetical protein
MAAIPVTLEGKVTHSDGTEENGVTFVGEISITGLGVGGGPVIPPPFPGGPPGTPTFPIWGPPGIDFPDKPGYPPTVGGGPILPPPGGGGPEPPAPPAFVPVWHPDLGWIVIPTFPVPTPSKVAKK